MAKPFKLFKDVSADLPGWEIVATAIREWLHANTTVFSDESFGWVDVDQSLIGLTTELFAPMRLEPVHVAIYVSKGETHTVHAHSTNEHARLNIPISNCDDSFTAFFETTADSYPVVNPQGVSYQAFLDEDCREIGRTTINVPTILHIRTPHQVIAPMASRENPRITATFQFRTDPILVLRKC